MLQRSKSKLVKPERFVITASDLNPDPVTRQHQQRPLVASSSSRPAENFARGPAAAIKEKEEQSGPWIAFSRAITCCIPNFILARWGGKRDAQVQQAWREKMALIAIIFFMCCVLAYVTLGLQATLCIQKNDRAPFNNLPHPDAYAIHGEWYYFDRDYLRRAHPISNGVVLGTKGDREVSTLFLNSFPSPSCRSALDGPAPAAKTCQWRSGGPAYCHSIQADTISPQRLGTYVTYEWDDLSADQDHFVVFNGIVLNVRSYLDSNQTFLGQTMRDVFAEGQGRDITRLIYKNNETLSRIQCAVELYQAGFLSKQSTGCFAVQVMNYFALVIILGLVLSRFVMAILYRYLIAPRLSRPPRDMTYLPPGAEELLGPRRERVSANFAEKRRTLMPRQSRYSIATVSALPSATSGTTAVTPDRRPFSVAAGGLQGMAPVNTDAGDPFMPYVMMMVTCYSEGSKGIRSTLESLARTDYGDRNKLFFIVADGLVDSGEGQQGTKLTTADICVSMLDLVDAQKEQAPLPKAYVAIADGAKQLNMARVYAGHFNVDGHSVPAIVVVKCGTEEEANEAKPGNRGKRDSQIILMNFLSKVMFDDRMSPLEYELFYQIQNLTNVTPDKYEMLLMVDADTNVEPKSLPILVNTMRNDPTIMGACGETQIANKSASWVSAIQVYEYFISHHLAKSFESMFGGVTCLPGCFSMYRIKAPKGDDGYWVPVLICSNIVEEYSQNVVDTLHKKNLLSLGEDRFLTTLMLKTFPKRKMMFIPEAVCQTEVPDKFSVLLSQRRRWINSTVHNLMELVLVRDLCGTFCFSMQFVVALELLGTVTLPAAIIFTYFLIYSIATPATSFVKDSLIPLVLLVGVLMLPGVLILLAARNKLEFFGWLMIYLLALPIWNFVLPVYAFWHFDDFSWGKTRQIKGEANAKDAHGGKDGQFDSRGLVMRTWSEWERERLGLKQKRVEVPLTQIRNPAAAAPVNNRRSTLMVSNAAKRFSTAIPMNQKTDALPLPMSTAEARASIRTSTAAPLQQPVAALPLPMSTAEARASIRMSTSPFNSNMFMDKPLPMPLSASRMPPSMSSRTGPQMAPERPSRPAGPPPQAYQRPNFTS